MLLFHEVPTGHASVWGMRASDVTTDMEHDLRKKASTVAPPMPGQSRGGIGIYRTESGQPRYNEVDGAYALDTYITTYSYVDGQYSFALIVGISLSETFSTADSISSLAKYAATLAETMNVADAITPYRILPVSLSEALSLADTYDFKGVYGIILSENLVMGDSISTNAALVAYAVNQNTGAVTTYNNFNVNSFAQIDGRFYGMTDDGIVELTGDTDNGVAIDASIVLGTTRLETDTVPSEAMKRLPAVYLGVDTSGDMLLRVTTDGVPNTYRLVAATNTSLHNGRMLLGKGVVSSYWDFELVNVDGADFTLESIVLRPEVLVRRIGER